MMILRRISSEKDKCKERLGQLEAVRSMCCQTQCIVRPSGLCVSKYSKTMFIDLGQLYKNSVYHKQFRISNLQYHNISIGKGLFRSCIIQFDMKKSKSN